MEPMCSRLAAFAVALFLATLAAPGVALGQQGTAEIYEREVFGYPGSGRVDPFRSLLEDEGLGIRIDDLTLRGVLYDPDPARSVAFLTDTGSSRRIQARIGERVGTLRVLAIYPERVEVAVEELGVSRRETLRIEQPKRSEGTR